MKRKNHGDGINTLGSNNPSPSSATLLFAFKRYYDEGIVEIVIRSVPVSIERPHGLKYRLNFGTHDSNCIVRYDNKRGTGDHRHIGLIESGYTFSTIDKLLQDFWSDVDEAMEGK